MGANIPLSFRWRAIEAHEGQQAPETPLTTAVFFAGFLALLLAEMMMGPAGECRKVRPS